MAIVTGNPHVDYVVTVLVTYIVSIATLAFDAAQKFYIYYPDVATAVSVVFGVLFLVYFIRNIVSIVVGLVKTLIKLTLILTVVSIGSWIYVRGFETFISDFKLIIQHFSEIDAQNVNDYAHQLKDQAAPLKDFVSEQYENLY
ncbi:putative membrane protein [Wickerhamomyces ciferrii]|uniref:Membrane protein n=1 Tax=Wickerhamomyces ciferrii (strain ATCC 14091 / BCRC 22168 / CBS 111 / JCM 3599 / NBRC 0793 / NRRL Y-1031 F-60-10) TaxID=1206466 RepID=K0KDB9_WICCF|nr:uncharacterized protein BN7_2652 [Wickerhamomyces ciferrii]CCH43105.1 putative membrane protein [Wickerhamomyces ciferrii]